MKGPKWLSALNAEELEEDERRWYLDCLENGAHYIAGPGTERIYEEELVEWPNGKTFGMSWSIDHSGPFPSWVKP